MNLKCPGCGAGREEVRVEIRVVCEDECGDDGQMLVPVADLVAFEDDVTSCNNCEHEGVLRDFLLGGEGEGVTDSCPDSA